MPNLKIAVAQVPSIKGGIEENINTHLVAIEKASQVGVSYIVFPELSLTGYEPELAISLAFSRDDIRLKPIIDLAVKNNIQVAVGAPLQAEKLPKIGLIIISPTGAIEFYEKMNLHSGERKYFSAGTNYHFVTIGTEKIANAICADMNNTQHAKYCFDSDASVYIAGAVISKNGYEADTQLMSQYATEYNMLVAMANHNQPTGSWEPIGRSAIWSKSGLLASASKTQNAIVVAEREDGKWSGQVFEI